MSATTAPLLIEIGTEELPPKALRKLSEAFTTSVLEGLKDARLESGAAHSFASPRRLAVIVDDVQCTQSDREVIRKGPPVSIAYDEKGQLSKAGLAFADKCGAEPQALSREGTDAGEWLVFRTMETGANATTLLPDIVNSALEALPVPRRMRWGTRDAEFVRPVHWVVLLLGEEVVPAQFFDIASDRQTRGHRFHAPGEIDLDRPSSYAELLRSTGFVEPEFAARRTLIVDGVNAAARALGGSPVASDALYDEVTALTEWPVPIAGAFDPGFLALPREVIIQTLTSHQRYFPVADDAGELLPAFVTVANLESKEPERVKHGNERVIEPRLADAVFFWNTDKEKPLADFADGLKNVVYQKGLGTLHEKSMRVAALASLLAEQTDADKACVTQAAVLAKCDLLSGMVGEFPELQGTMGRYYAAASNESEAVSEAIGEQYLPRFAGDDLPQTLNGQILAVADRLDTLAGVFLLGKKPTGNRDPFGLRRAALGVIRILIEKGLDIDFSEAVKAAAVQQPISDEDRNVNREAMYDYVLDRLHGYFVEGDGAFSGDMVDAVRARRPASLVDFHARLLAVKAFFAMDTAASLSAANKRIANILRKAEIADGESGALKVDTGLLNDDAERVLYHALQAAQKDLRPLVDARDYGAAFRRLGELRTPVDAFFDDVMVMVDDAGLRENRIALLSELRALFLEIADISRLTPV